MYVCECMWINRYTHIYLYVFESAEQLVYLCKLLTLPPGRMSDAVGWRKAVSLNCIHLYIYELFCISLFNCIFARINLSIYKFMKKSKNIKSFNCICH